MYNPKTMVNEILSIHEQDDNGKLGLYKNSGELAMALSGF